MLRLVKIFFFTVMIENRTFIFTFLNFFQFFPGRLASYLEKSNFSNPFLICQVSSCQSLQCLWRVSIYIYIIYIIYHIAPKPPIHMLLILTNLPKKCTIFETLFQCYIVV